MSPRLRLLLPLLAACGGSDPAPHLLWDPAAGELAAFPDDTFTVADPTSRTGLRISIDPAEIPELADVEPTYQDIFRDLSSLDGFGVSAGVALRFSDPIDLASLGSGEATGSVDAAIVLLVDGHPAPWPYEVRSEDEATTIILEPMRPLPPATEVAVVVTDRVLTAEGRPLARGGAMDRALAGEGDTRTAHVAPRMAAAAADAVSRGVVADAANIVATLVYTTQSVHEDALLIAEHIAAADLAPAAGTVCTPETLWIRCEGSFTAVDYRGADGLFEDELDGEVDASTTWELPFTAWLPLERPGPYGGEAFPVLIYGHGLGSGRSQGDRLAEFAAPRGMATIAIDALKHGDHPNRESFSTLGRTLDFFGIATSPELSFRPFVMRDHFRQSTYDKLQLIRMLELGVDLDGDEVVDLDASRLSYLGVSLGGIMGPELLALAPSVRAGVLVVPGGRVGNIVRDASQFGIVIDLMRGDASDGAVERFFPILQTVLDRGDPIAWAPALLGEPPAGFPGATPNLLMGMVLEDDTVPNSTNLALARALDVPVVPPERLAVGLVGQTGPAPVSANLADGRTAGMLQFDQVPDGQGGMEAATHSNIGDSEVGAEAWFRFLDSELTENAPIIVDPYVELGLR